MYDPMLLKLYREPFDDHRYTWFFKRNGIRAGVSSLDDREIFGRGVGDLTSAFPEVREFRMPESSLIDSELVIIDSFTGRDNFHAIQSRIGVRGAKAEMWAVTHRAQVVPFDILVLRGKDLRKLPLEERLRILHREIPFSSEIHSSSGTKMFENAKTIGMEGIVGKKIGSVYEDGARDDRWVKVRIRTKEKFRVAGFRVEENYLASFALCSLDGTVYRGKVGTGGLNDDIRKQLFQLIPSFPDGPKLAKRKEIIWKKTTVVLNVEYSDVSSSGIIIHPSIVPN
jgi:ATP-dependent DNA ligase